MIEIKASYDGDLYGILRRQPSSFTLTESSHNSDSVVSNILDNSTTNYWCGENIQWQYFTVSFVSFYFNLKSYVVQTGAWNIELSHYPKAWVVSGFDGKGWHNISTVEVSDMRKNMYAKEFKTDSNSFYKEFRVTGTGLSYADEYFFCINNFDMFGKINYKYVSDACTCKSKRQLMKSSFLFVLQLS